MDSFQYNQLEATEAKCIQELSAENVQTSANQPFKDQSNSSEACDIINHTSDTKESTVATQPANQLETRSLNFSQSTINSPVSNQSTLNTYLSDQSELGSVSFSQSHSSSHSIEIPSAEVEGGSSASSKQIAESCGSQLNHQFSETTDMERTTAVARKIEAFKRLLTQNSKLFTARKSQSWSSNDKSCLALPVVIFIAMVAIIILLSLLLINERKQTGLLSEVEQQLLEERKQYNLVLNELSGRDKQIACLKIKKEPALCPAEFGPARLCDVSCEVFCD